jgi:protein gp37
MRATKIEWYDYTINPIVGCSKCSPGCDNCHAERRTAILAKNPNPKISAKYSGVVDENGKWTGELSPLDLSVFDHLPRQGKRVLVGSMTDVFHEKNDVIAGDRIFGAMRNHPLHTFLVLTKRPEVLRIYRPKLWPLPNVWLGTTVCGPYEIWKIRVLMQIPAAKHFVSFEPLLAGVNLATIDWTAVTSSTSTKNVLTGQVLIDGNCGESSQTLSGDKLDWIICGGETGPNARPMQPDWVRSLRDQCIEAGVPFFFKGWGEWAPGLCDLGMKRVGKRYAGRKLDGQEWNQVPEND